jgi:CheY-like chemotaxis protein
MKKKEILFVDDESSVRMMIENAFTTAGYQVTLAENAESALQILKSRHFNVIFLDLNMPGMNGMELCKVIKKDKPLTIIYAITGYASLFQLADCREAGFEDYFIKPVNLEVLFKATQYAFEKIERWKKINPTKLA